MNDKTENNPSQLKKYSRIPSVIIEDKSVTFNHKKLLIFLYAINIHSVVPFNNILRGWLNVKRLPDEIKVPSQLRLHLRWLEQNNYLTINRNKFNKWLSITLNNDRKDISESRYIYVRKVFFEKKGLSLEHCAVAVTYQALFYLRNIYANAACNLLGIHEDTFRKYANDLHKGGFLKKVLSELSKFTQWVYALKNTFLIRRRTKLSYSQSINTGVDDISPLEYIFKYKYINNITSRGILIEEGKKSARLLVDFLQKIDQKLDTYAENVHDKLRTMNTFLKKDRIKQVIQSFLVNNSQKRQSYFTSEENFTSYMTQVVKKRADYAKKHFIRPRSPKVSKVPNILPTVAIHTPHKVMDLVKNIVNNFTNKYKTVD